MGMVWLLIGVFVIWYIISPGRRFVDKREEEKKAAILVKAIKDAEKK